MEVLNHLLAALGRVLLWVSSTLVLEELTLGGLARLLLSMPYDSRGGRDGTAMAVLIMAGACTRNPGPSSNSLAACHPLTCADARYVAPIWRLSTDAR